MKIVDLFIKLANGEEVPEKFKYKGKIYKAEKKGKFTAYRDDFGRTLRDVSGILYLEACLNDEIEIIEEDKEIEPLNQLVMLENATENESKLLFFCGDLQRKQEEIIKVLNELKKGK